MAVRSFFSDQECRDAGFSEPMIRTLKKVAEFVDTQAQLEETQGDVVVLDGSLATAEAAITALQAADVVLDGRIDAYDALAPFVRQDQTAAWTAATGTEARTALAAYAGQTISNPPTQAEVQTLDDAVKAIGQHLVALINDLRSNGALNG